VSVAFVLVAFTFADSWVSSFPVWLDSAQQNRKYKGECTRHDKYFADKHAELLDGWIDL
jgi:hypothetical protein